MRCRVQNVTRLPNSTSATKDREVTTSGNRLRIGRGTDNGIVLKDLSVTLRHADIVMRDFDIIVEAVGDSVPCASTTSLRAVACWPQIRSRHRPVPDPAAAAGTGVRPRAVDRVGRRPPRRWRRPHRRSYVCAAACWRSGRCPGCCFWGCSSAFWSCRSWRIAATSGDAARAFSDGPDGTTATGTLLRASIMFGTRRTRQSPQVSRARLPNLSRGGFRAIGNEECGACHGTVRHHFADPGDAIAAALKADGLDPARCNACHADHQGRGWGNSPTAGAVRQLSRGLGAVRGRRKAAFGKATDFGLDHPDFKADGGDRCRGWRTERLSLGGPILVRRARASVSTMPAISAVTMCGRPGG